MSMYKKNKQTKTKTKKQNKKKKKKKKTFASLLKVLNFQNIIM